MDQFLSCGGSYVALRNGIPTKPPLPTDRVHDRREHLGRSRDVENVLRGICPHSSNPPAACQSRSGRSKERGAGNERPTPHSTLFQETRAGRAVRERLRTSRIRRFLRRASLLGHVCPPSPERQDPTDKRGSRPSLYSPNADSRFGPAPSPATNRGYHLGTALAVTTAHL